MVITNKPTTIQERSFNFSTNIIYLVGLLPKTHAGIAVAHQIIRSGTSIGANIAEAQNAGTKKEFTRIMTIALKEARETFYWIKLIRAVNLCPEEKIKEIDDENEQIIRILVTIIKNSKK